MVSAAGGGGGGGLTYGDVRRWSSAKVQQSASWLTTTARTVETHANTFATAGGPANWSGEAERAASQRRLELTGSVGRQSSTARRVCRALDAEVAPVADLARAIAELDAFAQAKEFSIDDLGTVRDRRTPAPVFPTLAEADAYTADRQRVCDDIVSRPRGVMTRAQGDWPLTSALSSALVEGRQRDGVAGLVGATAPGRTGLTSGSASTWARSTTTPWCSTGTVTRS